MNPEDFKKLLADDDLGLLEIKPKAQSQCTADERLIESFEEINKFIDENGREPATSMANVREYQLYSRLNSIRKDKEKAQALLCLDRHNLLPTEIKKIESLKDIFDDDDFGLLTNTADDIFTLKYVRMETDFIAKRKPCENFKEFEKLFTQCQHDLKTDTKKLGKFNEAQIAEGQFFVLNGILLYINKLIDVKRVERGYENKYDGRTHLIFENGTESNMRYRSLCKRLFENGYHVSNTVEEKLQNFYKITDEDEEAGFIYIVKSLSKNSKIQAIDNLYKIGFSVISVEERIKNAEQEPTYLMAPVRIISAFKCFNMNPQKLEQLLHQFFGKACLNIDIFDNNGKRHMPREWFIAPLKVIERAIKLLLSGEIVNYSYDSQKQEILPKNT